MPKIGNLSTQGTKRSYFARNPKGAFPIIRKQLKPIEYEIFSYLHCLLYRFFEDRRNAFDKVEARVFLQKTAFLIPRLFATKKGHIASIDKGISYTRAREIFM